MFTMYLSKETVIYEYEEILMGKKNAFSLSFLGNDDENTQSLITIWRYAISHLLHWSVEDALTFMNMDIAQKLCLNKTFIYFKNVNPKNVDFQVLLRQIYPKKAMTSLIEETIDEYEHVLHRGRWEYEKEPYKFPKKFFLDDKGVERSAIILNYAISYSLGTATKQELYELFSNKKEANAWLMEQRLEKVSKQLYDSHLDYFHFSISENMKCDFLYYSAKYSEVYQYLLKQARKRKKES